MIQQIMLVVVIPRSITNGQRDQEKVTEKVRYTHFAHFWLLPSQGCWVSLGVGRLV